MSGVILAIGSLCSTLKDASNYVAVVCLLMMVPLASLLIVTKDPNGHIATALSWIPFCTPFVMMNRIGAEPPLFDLIGTAVLLVLCDVVILWLAAGSFDLASSPLANRPDWLRCSSG